MLEKYKDNNCLSRLAKEIGNLVGVNKACFNGRSRKNKCSCGVSVSVGRVCIQAWFIYYGCRLRKELL